MRASQDGTRGRCVSTNGRMRAGRDAVRTTRDGWTMTSIAHVGAPVRAVKAEDVPEHDVPLEPDHELPTLQPYRPSVGGWIGTGAGALGGLAVGGGIGAVIGLAADLSSGGMGGSAAPWIMGGLALAGLVGGGLGVYAMNENNYNSREQAKIQAEHGTATLEFARGMISQFDHNANGKIDLVNSTGLQSMDERVFSEERRQSRSHPKYDVWNDEWRTETERWTESRGTSAAQVWADADGAPKDQVVTDVELAKLMANYDADRSGSLTTPEQDAFKQAHPVLVEEWTR